MLGTIGLFGAGVAVGAGVGMLFSPVSAKEARAYVRQSLEQLKTKLESFDLEALTEGDDSDDDAAEPVRRPSRNHRRKSTGSRAAQA